MWERIDPMRLYGVCKQIDGNPSPGTYRLACLRAMTHGYIPNRQPFYEAISSYDTLKAGIATNALLLQGGAHPSFVNHFFIDFHMFKSAYTAPLGKIPLPTYNDAYKGQHSVWVMGAGQTWDEIRFVNTWGGSWGDRGFGILTREYLERYMTGLWLSREARTGPTIHNWDRLMEDRGPKEFARVWMLQNPRRGYRPSHRGFRHQIWRYDTISLDSSCLVDIIEIRTGFGLRIAWAHLYNVWREKTTLLKEFYVWPSYRRLGYGTIMEQSAASLARLRGTERMQVLFHEMDAQLSLRRAGRLFAESRGYTWKWRSQQYPTACAVGEKPL
jgi:GNAT superfamily N-acetyltransferase